MHDDNQTKSERSVKFKTVVTLKCVLPVDTQITLLSQIELLNKQLAEISNRKLRVVVSELFRGGLTITILLIRREIIRIKPFIQGIIHQQETIREF